MLIAILGPDGTGKTTVAKSLSKRINDLEYIYFGGSNESRKYRFFEDFIKSDIKNVFLKVIRKALRIINDLDIYYQAKKKHIISDRCPIDNYIITKIQRRKIRFYYYFILLLFPNPDLVILLKGNAEVIYKRKEELSVNDIKEYIKYYQEYLDNKQINYCSIDTVENDIENVLRLLEKEVITRF